MLARITNYGYRKVFPTCLGNLFIPTRRPIELRNPQAIKELQNYRDIQVEILEAEPKVDYSRYPINHLRKIAKQVGIKDSFFMKKNDLVKKLEGENATI